MTTDADAYQRLARALDAHRGDVGAYRRLGEQMTARRHLLGPRYGNRRLFVRERLLPLGLKENAAYKLAYDLENGKLQGRAGFSAGNMLALAQAYETTPDAIIAVLDGGNLGPPAPEPDTAWVPPFDRSRDPGREERARPFVDRLYLRYADLRGAGVSDPDGEQMFPGSEWHARFWDELAAAGRPVEYRTWFLAELLAREEQLSRQAGTDASVPL